MSQKDFIYRTGVDDYLNGASSTPNFVVCTDFVIFNYLIEPSFNYRDVLMLKDIIIAICVLIVLINI